jgi:hypothetical protein
LVIAQHFVMGDILTLIMALELHSFVTAGMPANCTFSQMTSPRWRRAFRAGGSAAIIGVGGGRDVLAAHYFGFARIVGIELNPGMVDLVTRRFRDYGGIETIPGFEIHNDEGRSYLSRTPEKFDVIQVSMVDTWAAPMRVR